MRVFCIIRNLFPDNIILYQPYFNCTPPFTRIYNLKLKEAFNLWGTINVEGVALEGHR